MTFRFGTSPAAQGTLVLAVSLVGFLSASSDAAHRKGIIKKLSVDPDAARVEFFEGIDQEALSVKMIAKGPEGGHLLVENMSDLPLTVEMPESLVGVHVLGQFGGGGFGGGGAAGGLGAAGGGGQATGGGGGGGGDGAAAGVFSIPPERVAMVPYHSVCLEHGKPDPHPRMTYKVIRTEEYTDDPVLQQLIALVANKQIPRHVAQAAAWNIANGISWEKLAAMKYDRIGVPDTPHFTRAELANARSLVSTAQAKAAESERDETDAPQPEVVRPRVSNVSTDR